MKGPHERMIQASIVASVVLLAGLTEASTWFRPSDCITDCDANHQCVSGTCLEAWDTCPDGYTATRRDPMPDQGSCYDNGCDWGGCERQGYVEVSSQPCVNIKAGCIGCRQETCCLVRDKLQCCQRVNCTEDLADCRIPQQRALGPKNSSRSDVYYTTIASGGTAVFPFYLANNVSSNGSCDAVRTWGECVCEDGVSIPGCLFNDSSTWKAQDNASERLPPKLSLTCLVLPPPGPGPGPPGGAGGTGDESDTGQGTLPAGDAGGGGAQGAGGRQGMSGGAIAGIVLVCVLGVMVLAGGALVLRNHVSQATQQPPSPSSYSAVFTGQSYTPGLNRPKLTIIAQAHQAWAYVRTQLARLRGEMEDGATAARDVYNVHRAHLEARLATKYPRSGPALPADLEEDDLYTLEDLEDGVGSMHSGYVTGGYVTGKEKQGRELELEPLADARHPGAAAQPLLQSPSSPSEPQGDVIHTTPVWLGTPSAAPTGVEEESLDLQRPPGHPLTPQPTGGSAVARGHYHNQE